MKTVLAIIGVLVILACAGLVLVFVIGVAAVGGDEAEKVGQVDAPAPEAPPQPAEKVGQVDAPAPEAPPQPVQSFVVGDVIRTQEWGDDWTLTVHSVHYPTGESWRPKDGQRFVMLDLEIVNASADAQILSSIMAYALKDSANYEYDNWLTSAAPGEEPGGDFAPGEAKRGPVVFQVPQDAGGFVFVFEPSTFGSERVFVTLE
jgi:hypothetical protein